MSSALDGAAPRAEPATRMSTEPPGAPEDSQSRHDWLTSLDRAHVWHPFTQMQTWLEPLPGDEPVIIDQARGCWLFDTKGRKYLDAISSLWVNVHGHRKPEIDRAIKLQLEYVGHTTLLGLASPPSIELAAQLVQRAPRFEGQPVLNKVFYSDSGSTAAGGRRPTSSYSRNAFGVSRAARAKAPMVNSPTSASSSYRPR